MGLRHKPTVAPASFMQCTLPSPGRPVPSAPQQSRSSRHKPPFGWQPLAGWQIDTPLDPNGAHKRLQQLPQPLQTVPSTSPEQLDEPVAGTPQTPRPPLAAEQVPEQQSPARLHTSPVWAQNELLSWHTPPLHSCEQHWPFASQALPLVRQVVFNARHLPSSHLPLQHSPSAAQVASSDTHVEAAHWPAKQLSEQHSVELAHASPAALHCENDELHVIVLLSHTPEQQSAPVRHTSANARQRAPLPPSPAAPDPA